MAKKISSKFFISLLSRSLAARIKKVVVATASRSYKNLFYSQKSKSGKGSTPPRGVYYVFKTGYSKRYTKQLEKKGIDVNPYNFFSVVSDLQVFTPAAVRDELIDIITEYDSDPLVYLESFGVGSDMNSQDSRLVSVTINLVRP